MGKVIDFDALSAASLHTDPYPWAHYQHTFYDPAPLVAAFPTDRFEQHSQQRILETIGKRGSDAWYQHNVFTRALLELGATEPWQPDDLDPCWLNLAEDLLSTEYRQALGQAVGRDLTDLRMQTHFWRFEEGSFFQPHVDKAHKIVTHLMYLTHDWTPEFGGCFQVLGSADQHDVRAEIPPLPNSSVLLSRTDNAWHSVSAMPRGSQRTRRLVQVWFWGH